MITQKKIDDLKSSIPIKIGELEKGILDNLEKIKKCNEKHRDLTKEVSELKAKLEAINELEK